MTQYRRFLYIFSLLLSGCAGLQPAQLPEVTRESAHLFGVTWVEFDGNGRRLASGGWTGDVAVWRVPEGSLLLRVQGDREPVTGLAWISEDQLVATFESGLLALIDTQSQRIVERKFAKRAIRALGYQAANHSVFIGRDDGVVERWSIPGLKRLGRVSLGAPVLSLAIDTQGRSLAVSLEDERVLLLDSNLQPVRSLDSPNREVLALRFSNNGARLAGGAWYSVYQWDLNSGRLTQQPTEHWGAVISLDFTPDNRYMVTLGRHTDASLRLVDSSNGDVIRRLMSHRLCGASVRISPNGRFVASGSDDESLRFYDLSQPYRPVKPSRGW